MYDSHALVFGDWEAAPAYLDGSQAALYSLVWNLAATSYCVPLPTTGGMPLWQLPLVITPVPFFFLIRLLERPIPG